MKNILILILDRKQLNGLKVNDWGQSIYFLLRDFSYILEPIHSDPEYLKNGKVFFTTYFQSQIVIKIANKNVSIFFRLARGCFKIDLENKFLSKMELFDFFGKITWGSKVGKPRICQLWKFEWNRRGT